jgi:hypothetical protein
MRKRELVHLHALLDRVRRFVASDESVEADRFEDYESLGVAPAAVYRSKGDHEDAVTTLATSLVEAIDEDAGATGEPADDRTEAEPLDAPSE